MGSVNREEVPPFVVQLFYRTGAFHRPDEFNVEPLPPHLTLHTWSDCTLTELSHQLADASSRSTRGPPILPDPAIGTRLAFRLIFQDTRSGAHAKYTIKELGNLVIGCGGSVQASNERHDDGGESTMALDEVAEDKEEERNEDEDEDEDDARHKTLAEARFVVGDYISCAILPPLADGSVAPASSARMGRGSGAGEARAQVGRFAPGGGGPRENGFSHHDRHGPPGGGRSSQGRRHGGGFGRFDDARRGGGGAGGGGGGAPMGEWRRGEALPDMPPSLGRRRGRGRY